MNKKYLDKGIEKSVYIVKQLPYIYFQSICEFAYGFKKGSFVNGKALKVTNITMSKACQVGKLLECILAHKPVFTYVFSDSQR